MYLLKTIMPILKQGSINLPAQAIIAESGPGMIERWCNFQSQMHNYTSIQRNDTIDLNKLSCF